MSGISKCELSVTAGPDGPVYAVVADLPAGVAGALNDALALVRHGRSLAALDAEAALALRTLAELADRMTPPAGVERHVVRLDGDDAAAILGAADDYLEHRDVDGYQPPAERERIARLREALPALRDAQAQLMLAGLSFEDATLT